MVELKDILRGLRERKQVSMDKMCEDLNKIYNVTLAKSTISKWENGKAEPSLAYARILTKYFDVTLDFLLGLERDDMYNFNTNVLSEKENQLINSFNQLNDLGKREAIKRVKELTEIIKYTQEEKEYLKPLAAHNSNGVFSEKDKQNDIDMMKDDKLWD